VARSIDRPIVISASWAVSGAVFGLSAAIILQWSALTLPLAAVVAGALSWLARGVGNLVIAAVATIVAIAAAYQATHYVFPNETWSFSWLGPCALAALVLMLLLVRRLGVRPAFARSVALVEFVAALAALLIAIRVAMRVSGAGSNSAGLFLLSSEDNDAWINQIAAMHNAHGVAELNGSMLGPAGPVIAAYLAGASAATRGIFPTTLPFSATAQAAFSSYCLLVAAAPIVVALIVRRVRNLLPAVLAWAGITVVVLASLAIWASYGSLSAAAAILGSLIAAYVISSRPRLEDSKAAVAWLLCVLLIFGVGASWIGLIPLAGAAIAACCLPLLGFAVRDLRRKLPLAALLSGFALVLDLELLQQYHNVTGPIGGKTPLFTAGGATPGPAVAVQAMIIALLVAIAVLASIRTPPDGLVSGRGYLSSLGWLAALTIVILVETARLVPGSVYAPTKLQFVVTTIMLALATAEIVARLELGNRQAHIAAGIAMAVIWAGTIQGGLIYDAATRHWPFPQGRPVWYDTVQREVTSGHPVFCLPVGESAPDPNNLDPWDCTRLAASLQGIFGGPSWPWGNVILGHMPVSAAIDAVKSAKDKPWRIVVLGPIDQVHNPKGWWAPITKLPGLQFVPASG
jgi:hypothetical protein